MTLNLTEEQVDLITESIRAYKNLFANDKDMQDFIQELNELETEIYRQDGTYTETIEN